MLSLWIIPSWNSCGIVHMEQKAAINLTGIEWKIATDSFMELRSTTGERVLFFFPILFILVMLSPKATYSRREIKLQEEPMLDQAKGSSNPSFCSHSGQPNGILQAAPKQFPETVIQRHTASDNGGRTHPSWLANTDSHILHESLKHNDHVCELYIMESSQI